MSKWTSTCLLILSLFCITLPQVLHVQHVLPSASVSLAIISSKARFSSGKIVALLTSRVMNEHNQESFSSISVYSKSGFILHQCKTQSGHVLSYSVEQEHSWQSLQPTQNFCKNSEFFRFIQQTFGRLSESFGKMGQIVQRGWCLSLSQSK